MKGSTKGAKMIESQLFEGKEIHLKGIEVEKDAVLESAWQKCLRGG
jgi:hypothetical protein